ncbi:hypothetical protein FNV43_RR04354 [Rhamnella rubrinervis]|uniref:Uncharacterized protein n=1 Tax=Rhamnella rubrinervis TaxID=2594499 RepID=A0A8K0HLR7_9ROSA|nr:hypothetical protein FNV43_RR04354 [Rhamnella rubrinervis]
MRTYGPTSAMFTNEIDIIMRNMVSQPLIGWGDAKDDDRKIAYKSLLATSICSKVLGKTVGTISGSGPATCKSYSNTYTALSSQFMQELEMLTQRVNKKDNAITELTQLLEEQALLIQSLVTRMNTSQYPSTNPTNNPPSPLPSNGATII